MLTLDPNSVCDVCAEEYGPHSLPRSIPCGHVLCENCSVTICEKTSPRLAPACPFCREPFTADSIRVIRVDCSSRVSTPRRPNLPLEIPEETIVWEHLRREDDRPTTDSDGSRARAEARRLEDRVARVAGKKCSVEEVHGLHKELQAWLASEAHTKLEGQHASLALSAALLRAILMNHLAHSESIKVAKGLEISLRERIEDGELIRQKLEGEIRKQKAQLAQKTQECQQLRADLSRLKINTTASSLGLATTPSHTQFSSRRSSVSVPNSPDYQLSPPATPVPSSAIAHSPSPLARYSHSRTVSMSSRSSTPTPSLHRSMTPGPGHSRTMTPAPPLPRATTPAMPILSRPPVPPKPRTLSSPSPPNHFGSRGPVDDREHNARLDQREREQRDMKEREAQLQQALKDRGRERRVHERWIPSPEPSARSRSRVSSLAGGSSRAMASATS